MTAVSETALCFNDVSKHAKAQSSHGQSWVRSIVFTPAHLDHNALDQEYEGSGTKDSPYIVGFSPHDTQDPMKFSRSRKWTIGILQALSFFALTLGSSVYASGIPEVIRDFGVSTEVAILGGSLYVLGFALGPLLWAPMSERGDAVRQQHYNLAGSRFIASAFGSSAQTNPGGMNAEMFIQEEMGLIMCTFAACPFLGPALGPILGGFIAETVGWRRLLGVNAILSGLV